MRIQTVRRNCFLLSASVILASAMVSASAKAEPQPILNGGISAKFELPSNVKHFKNHPNGVEFYQLDQSALGNRRPLLMVHGLLGEIWRDDFRWQKLCTYLNRDAEFRRRYKVYFARYNSLKPLSELYGQFTTALPQFHDRVGKQPIDIVALSMGGNVVAAAMADAKVDACVNHVMTLATPYHGSPLFTGPWMEYSAMKSHINPLTQLDTALPYQLYFNKHRNLLAGLNWDNSDRMLPTVQRFRLWYNPFKSRSVTPVANANPEVLKLNLDEALDKSKFTVYGGYLDTPAAQGADPHKSFESPLAWFFRTVLPEHLGKEHPVLRILNRQIANAVPAAGGPHGVYGLNDGITPLMSSLFVPVAAMEKYGAIGGRDMKNLREQVDVYRARVFKNADHLTFIDSYRPRGAENELTDELSQSTVKQPIFAWILHDILTDAASEEELAVGPKRRKAAAD